MLALVQGAPGFNWDPVVASALAGFAVMLAGFVLHRIGAWARVLRVLTNKQARNFQKSFEGVTGQVWQTYEARLRQLEGDVEVAKRNHALCEARTEAQQNQIDLLTSIVGAEAHTAVKELIKEVRGYREEVLSWRG
jgi:hypothetical protein